MSLRIITSRQATNSCLLSLRIICPLGARPLRHIRRIRHLRLLRLLARQLGVVALPTPVMMCRALPRFLHRSSRYVLLCAVWWAVCVVFAVCDV